MIKVTIDKGSIFMTKEKKCNICGSTNMLVKAGDYWLCFEHFTEKQTSPSEILAIFEEAVRNSLEYFDPLYAKEIRRRDRKTRRLF